jgi:hypothetical protein
MAVTALAWNLENFGTRYGNGPNSGLCEVTRCGLIANVVADAGAQVLVIQEMRRQGVPFLTTLQVELVIATGHADWHFDWIPGSVPRAGAVPPANFTDLGFTATGNQEGYAVLYRNNYVQAQAVSRSAGQDALIRNAAAANYIDIVASGKPIQFNAANPVIRFNAAGALAPLGFPASTCPDANIVRNLRAGVYRSNDVIPLQRGVRRPCQISIVDHNAMAPAPLSLVVYHAPVGQNNSKSPIYGTLLGFAANALAAGDRGYMGDFNIVVGNDLTILRNRANALNFVAQTYNAGNFINTSVHAAVGVAGPWHQGAGVRTSPRDIGLGTVAGATAVPDVLASLTTGGSGANTFLTAAPNQNYITNTMLPLVAAWFPANAAAVLTAFYNGGGYPANTDIATARALMFNLVLSDHLPVRIVQN